MASRVEIDELLIAVPVAALTPAGCRAWSASNLMPEGFQASVINNELVIDSESERELVRIPPSAGTLNGFRAWAASDAFPQRGQISFISGEIVVDMSPEHRETHNKIKTEISAQLHRLVRKLDIGVFYSDRTLLSNIAADLTTEPGGLIVLWASRESGRIRDAAGENRSEFIEFEGSPDWVLEIVSPSSIRKDTHTLRDAYFAAGIPELLARERARHRPGLPNLIARGGGICAGAPRRRLGHV